MKRLILGLALVSMAATSWAGGDLLVHPAQFCKKNECYLVPSKKDWSFKARRGGIVYGSLFYTFRVSEVPKQIRSSQETYGGFTMIKLNSGFISYGELQAKDVEDIHKPFLYAFKTPANELPKKLPFDNDILGYCYTSKEMMEKGTELELYETEQGTIIVGKHPDRTNIFVLNKDYKKKVLHIILAKKAIKHMPQVLATLNQDI
ncbi:hypothetical protein [Zooshikella sp. RANM57]|uniref:hypothetical protein n=1 Tax=Zooshikella sp. RANM57 TaxID=3425863 RepID=UPI003D6F7B3C